MLLNGGGLRRAELVGARLVRQSRRTMPTTTSAARRAPWRAATGRLPSTPTTWRFPSRSPEGAGGRSARLKAAAGGRGMDFVVWALRGNPELAIFLTIALASLIGRLKFGSFSLGDGRRLPSGRRGNRPARHQGACRRQGVLRSVPVHDRLQGRSAVLSRAETGRHSPKAARRWCFALLKAL